MVGINEDGKCEGAKIIERWGCEKEGGVSERKGGGELVRAFPQTASIFFLLNDKLIMLVCSNKLICFSDKNFRDFGK